MGSGLIRIGTGSAASCAASGTATAESTSAAASASASSFPSCPSENGNTYTVGSYRYSINCATDVAPGYGLQQYTGITSLKQCADLCQQYSVQNPGSNMPCITAARANSANVQQNYCWLKSTFAPSGAPQSSSTVDSAIQLKPPIPSSSGRSTRLSSSSAAASSSVFPTCPDHNGKQYIYDAYTYSVNCSLDVAPGYDLKVYTGVTTLQQCAQYCGQYNEQDAGSVTPCIAAVRGNSQNGDPNYCWLESTFGPDAPNSNPNTDAVIQIKPPLPSSSSTTSTSSHAFSTSRASLTVSSAVLTTSKASSSSPVVASSKLARITSRASATGPYPNCPADNGKTYTSGQYTYSVNCFSRY